MLTKPCMRGKIKGEIEMEAIGLKKKKKASKRFKTKAKFKEQPSIIQYSKLGLPIISDSHEIFEYVLKEGWNI